MENFPRVCRTLAAINNENGLNSTHVIQSLNAGREAHFEIARLLPVAPLKVILDIQRARIKVNRNISQERLWTGTSRKVINGLYHPFSGQPYKLFVERVTPGAIMVVMCLVYGIRHKAEPSGGEQVASYTRDVKIYILVI